MPKMKNKSSKSRKLLNAVRRLNPFVRREENERRADLCKSEESRKHDKERKMRLRKDEKFRKKENVQRNLLREDVDVRQKEKNDRAERRLDEDVRQKENEQRKQKHGKQKTLESLIKDFRKCKQEGPTTACISCKRLKFPSKMVGSEEDKLLRLRIISKDQATGERKRLLCSTCYSYVKKNAVPSIWTGNGFGLNSVPKAVSELNRMEVHLIAQRMPFMQIVAASHGGQKKLKGKVVNVPLSVEKTLKFLPRSLDETHVIAVQLKRKAVFKHWYLSMNITPAKVWTALQALRKTSLYRDVEEDRAWMDKTLSQLSGERDTEVEDDEDEVVVGNLDTCVFKNDMIAQIAPGDGRHPLFILMDEHAEEKAFPHLFGGEPRQHPDPMKVYPQIIRSEILNERRIFARDCSNLFYKLFVHTIRQINNAVNFISFRKQKGKEYTASQVVDSDFVTERVRCDEAFKSCLASVVNSPAYFDQEKNKVMAMIRQLGKPSIFLTLSPCEKDWQELHVILKETQLMRKLTASELKDVTELTNKEKQDLITSDPVITATYFNHRFLAMFRVIRDEKGIFADHPVKDYYYRVEYQQRGSPHVHMLLWLENVPVFDPKEPASFHSVERVIDKYISCSSENPYASYNHHHHTFTCYKTKQDAAEKRCRFNIPYPPMLRTQILTPLVAGENTDKKTQERRQTQWRQLRKLLVLEGVNLTYSELIKGLKVTHEEYINVLRTSIRRPTVFLKREWKDRHTSGYNVTILNEWQANTDIQWILDPYGLVHYLVNYINKAQKGMSEVMRSVRDQMMKEGNQDLRQQMKAYGKAFVDVHEVSAPEAVYTCLGIPQCKASRVCEYVNTCPPTERTRVLKNKDQLDNLSKKSPDSTDIYQTGLIERYSVRPKSIECMCLADFAAKYEFVSATKKKRKDHEDISDQEPEEDEIASQRFPAGFTVGDKYASHRGKPKILRHRRYNENHEPDNYYRENLMLYVPWRNEKAELLIPKIAEKYKAFELKIIEKRLEYNKINQEVLLEELAIAESIERVDSCKGGNGTWVMDEEYIALADPERGEGVDTVFGDEDEDDVPDKWSFVKNPILLDCGEFHDLVAPLNVQQRRFFHHYVHWLRQQMYSGNRYPRMHHFVTGPAGAGKSRLIFAITQATIRIACKSNSVMDFNSMKVILTAPTGKAAFNIGGTTLHSAFNLPVHKKECIPPLGADLVNSLYSRMAEVKTLIIDEISMVSRENFGLVDKRLRQIFGRSDEWFGGLNVLVFGDFYQIAPVGAKTVFCPDVSASNVDPYDFLNGPSRWGLFKFFELTEIMRQKDDLTFAERLTRFGRGIATKEDCEFFESLRRPQSEIRYDDDYVHLIFANKDVDAFNERALKMIKGREITCPAIDVGDQRGVDYAPRMTRKQKHGLLDEFLLKENARYQVILNVDTGDGLVNGGMGVLRDWDFDAMKKDPTKKIVSRVWIEFDVKTVGQKARLSAKCERAKKGWTPIERRNEIIHAKLTHHIVKFVRKQFPIVPAMAQTYHKSQGGTYPRVAVHISKFSARRCSTVYVALSRVTSSAGLIIFTEGDFKFPFPGPRASVATMNEMKRLKTYEQLNCVYDQLPESPMVLSFNIRSLIKHASDIANDPIMTSAQFMFLLETGLTSTDKITIPGYEERKRIPVTRNKKRGVSLFVKPALMSDVYPAYDHGTSECEYIGVVYRKKILVFGVYFSPDMKDKHKYEQLEGFIKEAKDTGRPLVVIGDFNTNFHSKTWKEKMNELRKNHKFDLRVLISSPTHDTGSCIDNVLTSSKNLQAVVYESVCSDHRPIFACRPAEPVIGFPFATASLDSDKNAAFNINEPTDSVPCLNDSDSETDDLQAEERKATSDFDALDFDSSDDPHEIDEHQLSESLANVCLTDRSKVREAEGLLDVLRPLIHSQDADVPFDEWEWKKIIDENTVFCEELLSWVRRLTHQRDENRHRLVSLSSDYDAIRHLPAPIRLLYRPLDTRADGSCYFNAVSLLLCGDDSLRRMLRLLSLYIFIKHRETLRQLVRDDAVMLEECKRTCMVASDIECHVQTDCWVDFINSILMCEIVSAPIIIIDYSYSFELAGNDEFSTCQSLDELNTRIRACNTQTGSHTLRFVNYVVNPDHIIREPFILSLSHNHYTALLKKSSDSENINPVYSTRVNLSSGHLV